jgi:NADPH-dependent curcumin reductase CurA
MELWVCPAMTTSPLTSTDTRPDVPARADEIRLARRPHGVAVPADFATVTVDVPRPGPGQLLVRNLVFSVDPYMRGRMDDAPSYAPAWELDTAMLGGAIGEVVAVGSPAAGSAPGGGPVAGTIVEHGFGWREYALVEADQVSVLHPGEQPLSRYLGGLGMTGFTAWVGLVEIAAMKPGDTVFVSGAAGAVGSLVGQLARARGAGRVIGSAGGPAKVAHLRDDLHYDAGFDYRAGDLAGQLAAAAPDGIDVYFDNVGGEHLEAALGAARNHARFAMCGSISGYNATDATPGPRNTSLIVGKRLRVEGFIVTDHLASRPEFRREVAGLLASGDLVAPETVSHGLGSAVEAFLGLFTGSNTGKAVVALADTSSTGSPVTA